ncbi:MAG: hypothetical protein K2K45_11640 [Muribaculaceae bacterium]|nr:hypothetical protein [Muribaculaceae bacterium]MDE7097145.1 hypothetical protein [Muribaculaceae bacterium]
MSETLKSLSGDKDGMATYDYIVNNVDTCIDSMPELYDNLRRADISGQFLASTARFLCAVDREKFAGWITPLVEGAIEKDRERRYIGSLLQAIWGADYKERAEELKAEDDTFRRIYKRIYPADGI